MTTTTTIAIKLKLLLIILTYSVVGFLDVNRYFIHLLIL